MSHQTAVEVLCEYPFAQFRAKRFEGIVFSSRWSRPVACAANSSPILDEPLSVRLRLDVRKGISYSLSRYDVFPLPGEFRVACCEQWRYELCVLVAEGRWVFCGGRAEEGTVLCSLSGQSWVAFDPSMGAGLPQREKSAVSGGEHPSLPDRPAVRAGRHVDKGDVGAFEEFLDERFLCRQG